VARIETRQPPFSGFLVKRSLPLLLILASPVVLAQTISPLDPPDTSLYLKWGPLWARPGFAISDLGYDSNVFAVADDSVVPKVGDYFVAVTPRLKGLVLFGQQAFLTFDANLQFYAYAQQRDLDYFNVFSNARLTVPFRRFGVYGDIGFDRTRDRPIEDPSIRPLRKTYPLGAGLIFKFGWRSDAEVGYTQARFTADDPTDPCDPGVPASCAINRFNDRTEVGARLKARYLAFSRTRVFLEVSQRKITFNYPEAAAQRDGDERRQFVGLDFGLGGRISGRFRIGHANFDLVGSNASDFNGPVADVALAYNFGASGSRVTLVGARDVRYTVFDVIPLYLYTGGDVTLFKYFNRFLGVQVGAGRATVDFLGDPTGRVDTNTTGTLGLLFRVSETSLGRRVEYALRYTRWILNSTVDRLDRNRGTIGFGVSFGY